MKHLVITVHGIRTFGDWQERLEKLIKSDATADASSIDVRHYKFGWFSIIAFLLPPLRWLVVRRFRKEFVINACSEKWDRIDMVGHSFGTHLIGWGLYGIRSEERPRVHTIILAGSVLKPSFPWLDLLGSCLYRLVNDCGIQDRVLIWNQIFVLFTGMAGRVGFTGITKSVFRNRYFRFGHSGYFEDAAGPNDDFMREKWVPLIVSDMPIADFDDPRRTSAVSGVVAFVLNNLEPIKLAVYVAPFIGLVVFYRTLWVTTETALNEAQTQRQVTIQMRSYDSYAAALRAVNQSKEFEALPLLLHALRIWPKNRLAADRLYGLMTQRTFALPVMGPATAEQYQSVSTVSGFGVSDSGKFRVIRNGIPREFQERSDGKTVTHELVDIVQPEGIGDLYDSATNMSADGRWFAASTMEDTKNWLVVVDLNTSKEFRKKVPKQASAISILPARGIVVAATERGKSEDRQSPSTVDLYFWRFAGKEPTFASQKLERGVGFVRGINSFPDETHLGLFYDPDPSFDRAPRFLVCALNAQESALELDERSSVAVPSGADKLFIEGGGKVLAFSSGKGTALVKPYAVNACSLTELEEVRWPNVTKAPPPQGSQISKMEADSEVEPQCWPGTDWYLFSGGDRLAIGERDSSTELHTLRLKAITPPMTSYLAGRSDYFLVMQVFNELSGKGRDVQRTDHCVFDGKQGLALPEIVPQGKSTSSDRGALPEGTTELARETNPSLVLSAGVEIVKNPPDFPNEIPDETVLNIILCADGKKEVPLKHDFHFGLFENSSSADARGAFSRDGKYVAVAAHDEQGFPLMVWDAQNGENLTTKQQPKGSELDDTDSRFGAIRGICFGDDPATLCMIDERGRILLWDWRRRMAFSDLLVPKAGWKMTNDQRLNVSELKWTEGKVQFVMDWGKLRYHVTYSVGFPQGPPKNITRLTQLVRAMTGSDADENGSVIPLEKSGEPPTSATIYRLRQEWATTHRDDDALAFCRWFLADRATRPVFPGAKQTVPELFEFFLRAGLYDEAEMLTFGDEQKIARVRERKEHNK